MLCYRVSYSNFKYNYYNMYNNENSFIDIFKNNIISHNDLIETNIKLTGTQSRVNIYELTEKSVEKIENKLSIKLPNNRIIKKTCRAMREFSKMRNSNEQFKSEINILSLLYKENHFPIILSINDSTCSLYMSDCGSELSRKNIPKNWNNQLTQICNSLKKYNIHHNDMIKSNFCVINNTLYLIDFGWSTIGEQDFPHHHISIDTMNNENKYYTAFKKL